MTQRTANPCTPVRFRPWPPLPADGYSNAKPKSAEEIRPRFVLHVLHSVPVVSNDFQNVPASARDMKHSVKRHIGCGDPKGTTPQVERLTMDATHLPQPDFPVSRPRKTAPSGRRACPECQRPLFVTIIDTGVPSFKWHTTECPHCGYSSSVVSDRSSYSEEESS